MIRTLIEVDGKDDGEFKNNLNAALDRLGYEPKESADETRWRSDLYSAMVANGIEPQKLVNEFRAARGDGI